MKKILLPITLIHSSSHCGIIKPEDNQKTSCQDNIVIKLSMRKNHDGSNKALIYNPELVRDFIRKRHVFVDYPQRLKMFPLEIPGWGFR
jgi:hypothetical protein